MVIVALIGAILLSGMFIFAFESSLSNFSNPLVAAMFVDEKYEYSIKIPEYWVKYSADATTGKVIYTGGESEYISIQPNPVPENYNSKMYGAYKALDISNKFNITDVEFSETIFNDKYIYEVSFAVNNLKYVIGFVKNDKFILDFEYRITDENDINVSIIVTQNQLKEVIL
jgi:hypothetical protein